MLPAIPTRFHLATWIDRGILFALLLACGCSLSLNVADADLWGHIQYGRDCWQKGLPATTTYSYIADGSMTFSYLDGWWTDAGTFESLLRANNLVAETAEKRDSD